MQGQTTVYAVSLITQKNCAKVVEIEQFYSIETYESPRSLKDDPNLQNHKKKVFAWVFRSCVSEM